METIESTTNYNMFTLDKTNRSVLPHHVQCLKNSISQNNLLYLKPISVNEEYVVVDGQHRLQAAQELGVPIYYVVGDNLGSAMILLNAAQKNWSNDEYLVYWAKKEVESYVKLLELKKKYKMSFSTLLSWFGTYNTLFMREVFRTGNYELPSNPVFMENLVAGQEIVEVFAQKKTHPCWLLGSCKFINSLRKVLECPYINNEHFIRKIWEYPKQLVIAGSTLDYTTQLVDIYNHRVSKKIKILVEGTGKHSLER